MNEQLAMQLNVPEDLEAQDAGSWADEERLASFAHIEEGYLQAERGELIDGAQARSEINEMKAAWRTGRTLEL